MQKTYKPLEVFDSLGNISRYSNLVAFTGGELVAENGSGNALQGWNEDFYTNGMLLHRGYYVDGKLITFKNFFDNGQCERVYENTDPLHGMVDIFFADGQLRKKIKYYNGLPQKTYDFYENGQPCNTEEHDKEMKYLTLKKSWYDNGNLKSSFEINDTRNKRYSEKNYYINGRLREEGTRLLLSGTKDYVKDGTWYLYDMDGKNKRSEKHSNGIRLSAR